MDPLIAKKKKILIADDDLPQRMILRMALEGRGYIVYEAEDGKAALDILRDDPEIRIIITDLYMPLLDGIELTRQVRKQERRYTYIIILTGSDDRSMVIKSLAAGADDYLLKPILEEELYLRIHAGERLLRLESQEALIFTMAKMAEYRSEETGLHLERIQFYCRLLANDLVERHPELDITTARAEEIARVSPLHDLGKISIPDQLLHKPGRLTDEEFSLMKKHTIFGGSILLDLYEENQDDYLLVAYNIAMYHHEKWDGSGYPQGLRGNEIPIEARIVALADVYDAISSKRCYKEAMDHETTKKIILDGRGSHFDPMIIDTFLRLEDIWLAIREKYADR